MSLMKKYAVKINFFTSMETEYETKNRKKE